MFSTHAKRIAALGAACAMLFTAAACGGSSSSSQSDGQTIISVNNTEPQSPLVPADTNEMGGGKVIRYLFEGLVSYDVKGKQHLEVAKSITPNDDATQYTIKIKDGWKFTNGEAVTAESFAKAWSYAANVKHAMKQASRMSIIKGYDELQDPNVADDAQLSGLEVKDDHTLVVTLDHPDSVFPVQIAHQSFFPLPSVAYKDIKAFGKNPVGNGPYKLKSWNVGKDITVVKNPDYKGSRTVKNDGIEFRVYTDENAAYSDVLSGNLDVLDEVPASAVKTFRSNRSVTAYSQPGSSYQGFVIPERLDHFGFDEEGQLRRQAISMAINRKQIVEKVYSNTKTVATDFTSPLVPEYSKTLKGEENLEYNPTKAKELWKKADAISPWSGSFKIAYNADGGHKQWVDAVSNQLKNTLGIDAQGDAYPTFSDIRERVTDRSISTAFRSGWMLDYPSAEDYMTPLYASASADGHGSNDGDYKNPEFDADLANALSQTDVTKRTEALRTAQEILMQDLPSIPLWCDNVAAVSAQNVKNVQFDYTNMPTYNTITK
ncbi:peptide ABC transporter substrate-binding protein [Bifidobacterium stellenboschense]|uniref:ABC transporter, substrate-binding protein, family 5 n=1 Tax=Bifidobacterium stellenboschense TaxID=762211 RepID=A0A087DUC4_9BIFI|nr:ABC transporter substrate-binding protein [Bifidobacterium stellenboschense]KFI99124.1 ABC transporter, substrate-binding protein, family 5 [Bifidobacterium stellenboschense]